jgi:general secretion pathway protein E
MPTFRLLPNNRKLAPTELSVKPVAIGRHPENDLVIDEDLASRFHCVIEPAGEAGYRLKDLGSRNGTKLNGQKIPGEVLLSGGDIIAIGQHQWHVEVAETKQERRLVARSKTKEADPVWVVDLREVIENLPPKSSADEAIVLIDADGKPSDALSSDDAEGARAVRLMLLAASKARATDIHVEPKGDAVLVRMRVDGQMITIVELPNSVGELALGVIRIACQMKMQGRDATYDGHCSARYQDRRVDFRASFTPTVQGQKLVLRLLDSRTAPQSLTDLMFPAYMHQRIRRLCEQDAGMLLCCGPTGSGKTTTLYNCLREIDRTKRNVLTIEDPVEYHIEGVTQIPVGANSSFGQLLRSVLRQDPDVILVGEIRDEETARTAMQAAMTGHVVFSTVHAKDSIGAVFRLLDLGIEAYLIANSMDVIIAQRLVRHLCEHCKRPVRVTPGVATRMGRFLEGKDHTFAATGCPKCLRTGFHGRRGIFEMLDFNDELRDVVLKNPTIQSMKKIIEQGVFTTLQQSGWQMASRGITTLEEAEKVASWS